MSAAALDIYVQKGETFRRKMYISTRVVDPITLIATDTPMDLTGSSARATIKTYTDDKAVPLAVFTCIIDADPTTGIITIELPSDVTAGLYSTGKAYNQINRYVWDMELVDSLGEVTRLFNGFVDVSPRVSKVAQYV